MCVEMSQWCMNRISQLVFLGAILERSQYDFVISFADRRF